VTNPHEVFFIANYRAFKYFELQIVIVARWPNTCSSVGNFKKDWLPGVAGPNLDSVSGFGASIQKRGLAPAPFFHFWWCSCYRLSGDVAWSTDLCF